MTIYATDWSMTSDITPETAHRVPGDFLMPWRLSWLPDRRLSAEQARAGMELDEIVSDPALVYDQAALARGAHCAGMLGLLWEHAIVLLSKRLSARLREGATVPADLDEDLRFAGDPPCVLS
ncbi:hypothetical protein [Nocardia cyriacigeorgica]|uniref:Uncharacterized protein n=1 Tax=Nocardia cyriacigeorgica TaxID=135487 RepID=A0A4U8VVL1_9NOCA|nr:hypothetical protein [Nocardia cyriacigeorgica]MBF6098657.1 hypothetical protein [Nocardia cyriacigeorgica]MBF6320704.1 hypothetical protein [Nocardia cyriacigeorgica]MBF6345537.1 hypothetical protein [Nocardia cyriacigeorgica]MBF6514512.1 hypothetical protein [Nocardia cyriacigeorgica]MBF6535258.1 hypothetical protein [Nocardia cyriacigeorgica]